MVFNVKDLKWTREPEWYSIEEDKIESLPNRIQIYGKELIIIFEMTMYQYYR